MIRGLLRVLGAGHATPITATVVVMGLTAVAEGAAYALLLPVLDALLGSDPARARPWIWGFGAAVGMYALLRILSDLLGFRVATSLLRSMYHRLGDHIARLPIGWFSTQRTGELSVLASRGILDSLGSIAHLLLPYITAILTPLTIVVVMLSIDITLGAVAVATIPIMFCGLRWTNQSMAALDGHRQDQEHDATDRTVEFLRSQPLLRASRRFQQRLDHLENALLAVHRTGQRLLWAVVAATVGTAAVVQAALTALLVIGAVRAVSGYLSAAEVMVILILASRCVGPLMTLSEMSAAVRGTEVTLAALEQVLETEPLPEPTDPQTPVRTDLEFDAVSWRPQAQAVIDGISLRIPEGQRIAIVGPSGAGKSTLLHLLARFHDVDTGAVRIGGVDVREIAAQTLSQLITFAFQDVFLFDATIEENIRIARPEASDADVRHVVTAAGLDETAARLPQGWQTTVGEEGEMLSGGERQRVTIARALLKDAPIVLLDEISAALDPLNESAVHDGIDELTRGRTTVMVAHRMHTIRQADRIVFVDHGRVIEEGTHDDLMVADGRYAEFVRLTAAAEHRPREEDAP